MRHAQALRSRSEPGIGKGWRLGRVHPLHAQVVWSEAGLRGWLAVGRVHSAAACPGCVDGVGAARSWFLSGQSHMHVTPLPGGPASQGYCPTSISVLRPNCAPQAGASCLGMWARHIQSCLPCLH